jgi:tetrahydromethanopterin S-methyltransferase subunit G
MADGNADERDQARVTYPVWQLLDRLEKKQDDIVQRLDTMAGKAELARFETITTKLEARIEKLESKVDADNTIDSYKSKVRKGIAWAVGIVVAILGPVIGVLVTNVHH